MKDEIEQLRHKVDEETRVNAEIESYLRTHQSVSSLDNWHSLLLSQILHHKKCALTVVLLVYMKIEEKKDSLCISLISFYIFQM